MHQDGSAGATDLGYSPPRRKRLPVADPPSPSLIASEGHGGFVCQPGIYTGFQPCSTGLASSCRPYRTFGGSLDSHGGIVLCWQVLDEAHLIVGTSDGIAAVWDTASSEPKTVLCHTHVFAEFTESGSDKAAPALGVVSVAYYGGYIATGASDGVVRIWKAMNRVAHEDVLFVKAIFPPPSFPPCEQIHFAIPMVSRRTDTLEGVWVGTSFGHWIGYPDRLAARETSHEGVMAPYASSDVGRLVNTNCVAIGNRKSNVCIACPNRDANAIEILAKLKLPGVGSTPVSCLRWRDDGRGLVAGVARGSEFRVFLLHWDTLGTPLRVGHSINWPRGHGERLLGVDWHDGHVLGIESAACMVFREDHDEGSEAVRLVGGRREREQRTCKYKRRMCLQAETPVWCMGAGLGGNGSVLCAWDNRIVKWHSTADGGRPLGAVTLTGHVLGMFRMDSKGVYVVNGSEVVSVHRPAQEEGETTATESTTAPGEWNGETANR
ncbi:hypothetical protein FOZ62_025578 [Perkinsus olseni]|uniref:Uncharacterized protein n=1 Tax=Perkinsus olseni TaxID=32597 RepID=A0A7J6U9P4_PEROL|nr:hypothetical protein FOZ62_025578 [Perkinsus olseni]